MKFSSIKSIAIILMVLTFFNYNILQDVKQLSYVKDETFVITTKNNKDSLVKINNSVEELASFEVI